MAFQHDPARRAVIARSQTELVIAAPATAVRKRLRKLAERRYPGRSMAWFGGILYFIDRNPRLQVLGVPHAPDAGCQAIGYAGAQPARSRSKEKPPRRRLEVRFEPSQSRSQRPDYSWLD